MRKIIIFSLLTLGYLFVLGPQTKSYAQTESASLAIVPPSFDLALEPGESTASAIRIENLTDKPINLKVVTRNFTAQGEEGDINLTEEESTFSLAKWITVTPNEIIVPQRSKQTFNFTISVPPDAEPGGHFGSIVFTTTPTANLSESGALLAQEIGSLILTRVAGQSIEKAEIESFTPDVSFAEFGPISFTTRVKNLGNVHIKPTGIIEITDMLGNKAVIPLESKNVLPEAVRKLSAKWGERSLIGKYTATLVLTYGSSSEKITASTEFYMFPVRYALAAFAGLFILFIIRKRLFKALKILIGKEK